MPSLAGTDRGAICYDSISDGQNASRPVHTVEFALAATVWPYEAQVIGVVVCAGALVAEPSGLRASTSYQ
jgi:hypothetical protein